MEDKSSKKQTPLNPNPKESHQNSGITYFEEKISIKVTAISIFAALAIVSSYLLAPLINIEVLSVLLFISGFLYGKYVGLFVGLISSIVYYGWNPFGVSPLPMFIVCVGCMTFIGLLGGIFKPYQKEMIKLTPSKVTNLAFIGFLYTLLFDISTNLVYAYIFYGGNIKLAFITGFPFMIIHLISNTILFALLVLPVYNTILSFK